MFSQLILGSVLISLSIFIEVLFIFIAIKFMQRGESKGKDLSLINMMLYLTGITMWMLLAFSIVAWVWATALLQLGAMPNFEESLYFSMVTITSLGFGDIVLEHNWRILSGMMSANGLVLFGLNTAIIVETLRGILQKVD